MTSNSFVTSVCVGGILGGLCGGCATGRGLPTPPATASDIVAILDQVPSTRALTQCEGDHEAANQAKAKIEEEMRLLQPVSTSLLQSGLDALWARATVARSVVEGQLPESALLSKYPVPFQRDLGEDRLAYSRRVTDHCELILSVEVWVDRYLFDAPDRFKRSRPLDTFLTALDSPRTHLPETIDPLYPLVKDSRGNLSIATCSVWLEAGEHPYRPWEFESYSATFPRRSRWWK